MHRFLAALVVPLLAGASLAAVPAPPDQRDACAEPRPNKTELAAILRAQTARRQFDLVNDLARGVSSGKKTTSLSLSEDGASVKKSVSMTGGAVTGAATDEDVQAVLDSVCPRRQAAAQAEADRARREAAAADQRAKNEEAWRRYEAGRAQSQARLASGGFSLPANESQVAAPVETEVADKCETLCSKWTSSGCSEAPNADSCRPIRNIGNHNGCACVR